MKVLVSTTETQGQRNNDFCFVPEGELVKLGFECDRDKDADGYCGCRRSLDGVTTSAATTTFKVSNFEGSEEQWRKLIEESYYRGGWKIAVDNAELLRIAAKYPVGAVLEKRGNIIQQRQLEKA